MNLQFIDKCSNVSYYASKSPSKAYLFYENERKLERNLTMTMNKSTRYWQFLREYAWLIWLNFCLYEIVMSNKYVFLYKYCFYFSYLLLLSQIVFCSSQDKLLVSLVQLLHIVNILAASHLFCHLLLLKIQ